MPKPKKKKNFLKIPEYPGGKEAFKKFIKENLKYPKKALENRIEGIVFLNVEINDNGKVINAKVSKGPGYGCDKEAIRLVKLMKYGKVKNRGLRVKTTKKVRIGFKLDKKSLAIKYELKKSPPPSSTKEKKETTEKKVYGYTIELKV